MADIALGGVERIFKAGFAIKKAVQTARQNKKECRGIESLVTRVNALLLFLNQMTAEVLKHPAISGPLVDLAERMEEAVELIEDCEGRHPVRRLLGAGGMARELLRVRDDILQKLMLCSFATNLLSLHITLTLTRTVQCSIPHPPSMQLQDAVEAVNPYSGHLTTDDAISGFNSEITMVTTSSEVPNDPSSRLTEFNLPELEAVMHHVSEEITSGGGHSLVFKQKIAIKISISSERSRSKALVLASSANGVASMGITGDVLEVIGSGVDTIKLLKSLRRKLGHADLLQVSEIKAKEAQAQAVVVMNSIEEARLADTPDNMRRRSSGIRSFITKLSEFMWPHDRPSISHPQPSPPPLHVEHTAANPAPASASPSGGAVVSAAAPLDTDSPGAAPQAEGSQQKVEGLLSMI